MNEWTDQHGDTLTVIGHHDGDLQVFAREGHGESEVLLERGQVAQLRDALDYHLTDTAVEPTTSLPDAKADGYSWPEAAEQSILQEAHSLVYGDRNTDYGHPREDFTRTALMWTALLGPKLADGAYVEPEDVARAMVAVKLSRDVNSPKRDNRVDGAGYFLCLDRLETGR